MVNSKGVTLLELLGALTLAIVIVLLSLTLYRQGGISVRHFFQRNQGHTQSLALEELLAKGIMQGSGLRRIGPQQLEWISRDGRLMHLQIASGDTVLRTNDLPSLDSICSFSVTAQGRQYQTDGLNLENPMGDSLDADLNGMITWDELDRDGDGELDTSEIGEVRLVTLSWIACGEGKLKHNLVLSPRNRLGPAPRNDNETSTFQF